MTESKPLRMTLTLRDRVTRALHDELHAPYDEPWDECPQEFKHRYEFMASTALAALGLDDLGAAVERAEARLIARFPGLDYIHEDSRRNVMRECLEAALTATAPTSGGEGVASESRSGTAIAGEAKGHPAKDSQVAADAPSPSGGTKGADDAV